MSNTVKTIEPFNGNQSFSNVKYMAKQVPELNVSKFTASDMNLDKIHSDTNLTLNATNEVQVQSNSTGKIGFFNHAGSVQPTTVAIVNGTNEPTPSTHTVGTISASHDPIELNTNFAVLANSVIELQQALMNMGLSK